MTTECRTTDPAVRETLNCLALELETAQAQAARAQRVALDESHARETAQAQAEEYRRQAARAALEAGRTLAEIGRLRGRVGQLETCMAIIAADLDEATRERDQARAELARLRLLADVAIAEDEHA